MHVVRRRDGHSSIVAGNASIDLDPTTARAVGAFLAGRFAMPPAVAERIDDALGSLVIDWVSLRPGDPAVGRTIADLEVRRRTGVTVVAVLRGSVPIVAPDPLLALEGGDDLVVACRPGDLDRFVAVMTARTASGRSDGT